MAHEDGTGLGIHLLWLILNPHLLRALAETAGDRLLRGVVLHLEAESVAFGRKLHALPISGLWN